MTIVVGQRFGRWSTMTFTRTARGRRGWECRCDCGAVRVIEETNLRNGSSKSCGCLKSEVDARAKKHGCARKGSVTPEFKIWQSMIRRCYEHQNRQFANYGGRGIAVCDRWRHDFAAFLADVGPRPAGRNGGRPLYSLDRINNDGNYEPGNVRWATQSEQCLNKRHPRRRAA